MRCMGLLNHIIKNWRFLLGFLVVLLSFPTILLAKPARTAVIANGTHATHLIQGYLKTHPAEIEAVEQTQDDTILALDQLQQLSQENLTEKIARTQPRAAILLNVFPVRSSRLTPGKVITKHIQATLSQPIFIVGDDAMSKAWLRQYQQHLAKLRAKGYVVNVPSKEAMQALTASFSHLSLMAIPGDSIAKNLGLKHYPALISNNLIEQ